MFSFKKILFISTMMISVPVFAQGYNGDDDIFDRMAKRAEEIEKSIGNLGLRTPKDIAQDNKPLEEEESSFFDAFTSKTTNRQWQKDYPIVINERLSKDHQDLVASLYHKLYALENQADDSLPIIEFGGRLMKEGDSHPHIPLLRDRLIGKIAVAESEESANEETYDPTIYDETLANAVRDFQGKNGLKRDAILGPTTLSFLNRSKDDIKQQILVNIARMQSPEWYDRPPLRIEVDVARYMLTAYEDDQIAFEMPVVVGSKARKTNIFTTVMTGVRINPGWTLPPTIKAEDYIPKLRENPSWVTDQGVMIYTSWDRDAVPVDPMKVDWDFLTDNDIKAMRFYKQAGNNNPLGKFRFLMNNRYDIYLHDTNQKYLFDRSNRAKSSGCVRVFDPQKIAEFLLKDDRGWDGDKIRQILDKGKTMDVGAKRSIPVYFDYKTAWLNDENKVILGHDIYGFDDQVKYDKIEIVENKDKNQKQLDQIN